MQIKLPLPVIKILQTLEKKGFEVYVVGGAVRDLMMGIGKIRDWDFTTNATPKQILSLFNESFYDNNFGTVMVASEHIGEQFKLKIDEEEYEVFDITTFRKEYGYTDKRRPDKIEWGKTIEDDLGRRDFTVNAIALKITNYKLQETNKSKIANLKYQTVKAEVIDPYEGQKDLEQKLIHAVGDANERFNEDALRMIRAIRLGAQLGFQIEKKTLEAIQKNVQLITHISWERIGDEFMKILSSDFPADGVTLLYSAGLLTFVMPELPQMREVPQGGHHIYDVWKHSIESLRECPSTDPVVRLATLLHDIGKPKTMKKQGPRGVTFYGHEVVGTKMAREIGKRLRLSKKQIMKLKILVRWHMFNYDPKMTDAAIRRFIKRVGKESINDMMLLRVGDRKGGGSKATSWRLREFQQRIGEQLYEPLSVSDLKIDGKDVMKELKLKPGPKVGEILNTLFEEVMEDTSKNEKEYLLKRVKELG